MSSADIRAVRSALTPLWAAAVLSVTAPGGHALAAATSHPKMRRSLDFPASASTACTDTPDACFTLVGVTIDGATKFSAEELAQSYEDFLLRPVSLDDLTRIALAITDRYHAAGYFLSRAIVPAQHDLKSGLARIVVLEGRITSVSLSGDAADIVAPFLDAIDTKAVANTGDLERTLTLARDVPGVTLETNIAPNPRDARSYSLVVKAKRKRTELFASLDNGGSKTIGPWQTFVRAKFNSLFHARDQLSAAIFTTPPNFGELSLFEGSYRYMFTNGATLSATGTVWHIHDGYNPLSSQLGGDGQIVSLRVSYPLLRRRHSGVWAEAAFDVAHIANDWSGGGGFSDETRVARAGLRAFHSKNDDATSIALRASVGLDVLGASGPSVYERSRYDADGQFFKVDLQASHYHSLGRYWGLLTAVSAQWAANPLPGSEEFTLGGRPFGHGYNYGELSGDYGAAGWAELRAGYNPNFGPITFLQGYTFVDGGAVWNFNRLPAYRRQSLMSAGVGTRVVFDEHVTLRLEGARPMTRVPLEKDHKSWRPYVSLSVEN